MFDEVINLDEADAVEPVATEPPITLEQLGKFTALCLKYPLLQRDIERDECLLAKLYQQTSPSVDTQTTADAQPCVKVDALTEHWLKNSQIQELLQKGCDAKASEEDKVKHSLKDVKVKHLLQIAPEVVHRADYSKLHDYLKKGQWREADEETLTVMLKVARREDEGYLLLEDISNFPCEDLRLIDRLWVHYSNGHFGFSVQKQIWQECGSPTSDGKDWDRFCVKVGWQNSTATAYVSDSDLKYNPKNSPAGELPWYGGWVWLVDWGVMGSSLAQRLVNCSTSRS